MNIFCAILCFFFSHEVTIQDAKTKETLAGVRIETNHNVYYSDFDGHAVIPNHEKIINISYVSYEDVIASGSIILMSPKSCN